MGFDQCVPVAQTPKTLKVRPRFRPKKGNVCHELGSDDQHISSLGESSLAHGRGARSGSRFIDDHVDRIGPNAGDVMTDVWADREVYRV